MQSESLAAGPARTATVSIEPGGGALWRVTFESEAVPGTLAAFAGVLSFTGLDIVSARVELSLDGASVKDTFEVVPITCPRFSAAWADELAESCAAVLAGRIDVRSRLEEQGPVRGSGHVGSVVPTEVDIDLQSEITTGIRVRATDRPGLLYDITATLSDHGLRTRALAALTIGGVARDMFRVVDAAGEPPKAPAALEVVRADLLRVCR